MNNHDFSPYLARYRKGEWRAPIFRDMILADMRERGPSQSLTVLDIGCGRGFDDDKELQASLATEAKQYIGVEPDMHIDVNPLIDPVHRCCFEEARIPPGSVDVAFAVMVLEHLQDPAPFWNALHTALKEGGVFWGLTVDSRHWFAKMSLLTKKLHVKDFYLNLLHGQAQIDRYENYPVHYRSNSPKQIERLAHKFQSTCTASFHRVGLLDNYLPTRLRWVGRRLDEVTIRRDSPGCLMIVRAEK